VTSGAFEYLFQDLPPDIDRDQIPWLESVVKMELSSTPRFCLVTCDGARAILSLESEVSTALYQFAFQDGLLTLSRKSVSLLGSVITHEQRPNRDDLLSVNLKDGGQLEVFSFKTLTRDEQQALRLELETRARQLPTA
jgi:hypothetical protein